MTRVGHRENGALHRDDEEALDRDGWLVVDLLPATVVDGLATRLRSALPTNLDSFYATAVHADRPLAAEIDGELKRIVGPYLRAALPTYGVFLASVIAKGHSTTGEVAFHQDWTFTDERRDRCLLCWIPLVDTDHDSGALRVVSGSHRWTTAIRPSGHHLETDPLPPEQQALADDLATTVPMSAGQGLVYDAGLLHGSGANASDHDRLVVNLALRPAGAPLVHFHLDADGRFTGHTVDASHFTTNPFGTCPAGVPAVQPWAGPMTAAETGEALRRASG